MGAAGMAIWPRVTAARGSGGVPPVCETGPDVPQPTRGPAASPEPHRCRAADARPRSTGRPTGSPPPRSAIVFVIDGLGAHNLTRPRRGTRDSSRRAGRRRTSHARSSRRRPRPRSTSLLTGAPPGEHGIVGYRALVPGTDDVVNQLRGWDTDAPRSGPGSAPSRSPSDSRPRGGRASSCPRPSTPAPGSPHATMRGARVRRGRRRSPSASRIAADLAARHPGAFVYVYAPDLDAIGHKRGWQSDEWVAALERVDAAARGPRRRPRARRPARWSRPTTAWSTCRATAHVLLDRRRRARRRRAPHRRRAADAAPATPSRAARDAVLARWRACRGGRSWVLAARRGDRGGLFGEVDPEVRAAHRRRARRGAQSGVAYYDDRLDDKGAQRMVGQHGSLTDEERTVPLIRLGAFA